MVTLGRQYLVNRPLYSKGSFAGDHRKIYRQRKTLWDHVKQYSACDSKRVKTAALSLLPIIGWIRIYRVKEWLLSDVVSGAIMQGLTFSLLASLPPIYGLYMAFFPTLTYFFLGSSRHICRYQTIKEQQFPGAVRWMLCSCHKPTRLQYEKDTV